VSESDESDESDESVVYTAPVLRRWSVFGLVGGLVVVAIVLLVTYGKNQTWNDAFVTALFITLGVLALIILLVLALTMPTRIEVTERRIRLVAPRAISRYEPGEMVIRRTMRTDFALVRKRTGRTLARFRPPDAEQAAAAFTAVGAQIVNI
jgi:hypothetical protein